VAVLDSSNAGSKWDFLAIAALCERYSPKELPGIVPGNFIYPEELELYAELLEKETRRGRDLALILNRATGSICDTGRKTTDGRPSWAATREMAYWIYHEWPWFRGELVPDGGLSGGADMGKMAIFPRVRAFMFGRLAAQVVSSAAEECPDRPGFKIYYGMGSNRAREEAARNGGRIGDRYKVLLEEGVVTLVPIVGSFHDVFDSELEALAATFIQTNCSTFDELNSHGRWTWISQAGRAKLNPHSLIPLPEKA